MNKARPFKHLALLVPFIVVSTSCTKIYNIRSPDASSGKPGPITVLTYNIRLAAGLQNYGQNPYTLRHEVKLDIKPLVSAIKSVNPDVVGLQEVNGPLQAAEFANALNMNYTYAPHGTNDYGSWWGVAILSKFPISNASRYSISKGLGNTRSILSAEMRTFGKITTFINIHKDPHQTQGDALRRTMQHINNVDTPVILMGDLNMGPDDHRQQIFSQRLLDSASLVETENAQLAKQRGTYPGKEGAYYENRIDYILVDKEGIEVLDAGLIDEQYWNASDHIGYYAIIKLH